MSGRGRQTEAMGFLDALALARDDIYTERALLQDAWNAVLREGTERHIQKEPPYRTRKSVEKEEVSFMGRLERCPMRLTSSLYTASYSTFERSVSFVSLTFSLRKMMLKRMIGMKKHSSKMPMRAEPILL